MDKIMVIDKINDIYGKDGEELTGKECFNKNGESVKVKNPKGSNLRERWDELQVGKAYSFDMATFTPPGKTDAYPYVRGFKSVEGKLAEQASTPEYAPQEIGMWWKELGSRIGDGSLDRDYPKSTTHIKGQYYKKLAEVTGVAFKEQDSPQ